MSSPAFMDPAGLDCADRDQIAGRTGFDPDGSGEVVTALCDLVGAMHALIVAPGLAPGRGAVRRGATPGRQGG